MVLVSVEWPEQGAEEMLLDGALGKGGPTLGGVWVVSPRLGAASPFPWSLDLFLLLGEEEICGPSGSAFLLIQS